jgi:cytochrome c55X
LPLHGSAAALTFLCLATSAASAIDGAREEELRNLVRQDCGSCHGLTLKGGLGRPLTPKELEHLEKDGLAAIILEGIPGKPMPPWRGLLTVEDAQWIAEMLKEGFPP